MRARLHVLLVGIPAVLLASVGVTVATAGSAAASCGFPCMTNHGGVVEASSSNVVVEWGNAVDGTQLGAVQGFLSHVGGFGYLDKLSQYGGVSNTASYVGTFQLGQPATSSVDQSTIGAALESAVTAGTLPASTSTTNYVVMLPPGTTATRGSASAFTDFCSYHAQATGAATITFAVLPDYGSVPSSPPCPAAGSASALATMNAAHTLLGMLTDPAGDAWHDGAGNEVADESACPTAINGHLSAVSDNGFTVPLYWSEHDQSCTSGDDGVHFTQQPPDKSSSTSATVSWSYVDGIGTAPSVTCAFDHATAVDCTNVLSRSFTGLGDGGHEFEVRLSDQSQVLGQIQSSWIVDTFKPITFVFRPPYFTTSPHPTFNYQSGDPEPIAYYDVRFRHATPTTGFSAWATPPGGTHRTSGSMSIGGVSQGEDVCVEARATDDLGNVGGWSTQQCTTRMVDDHSSLVHHPSTSRYWSRGSGSGYYFATYTRTYRSGQVLTIAGRSVRRAAILVTTCPTCGSLLITFAGHKVAGFRLYSKTRRLSVLIGLPTFALGNGLLALKTTGGRVTIDGVGLSAT